MKIKFLILAILILAACNDKPDVLPENNQLAVFPNPASDFVYISFANTDASAYSVVVFDTKGDIMLEKSENATEPWYQVNVSDEPAGTYHVVLEKNNTTIVRQFSKIK